MVSYVSQKANSLHSPVGWVTSSRSLLGLRAGDQGLGGEDQRNLKLVNRFARESPTIEVDRRLDGHRVAAVLAQLASHGRAPKAIGVERGPEFTSEPT